jgi:hypothetical protein
VSYWAALLRKDLVRQHYQDHWCREIFIILILCFASDIKDIVSETWYLGEKSFERLNYSRNLRLVSFVWTIWSLFEELLRVY